MLKQKNKLTVFEMVLFALLGAITFLSKFLMQALPNIHLVGVLIMSFTLVFRKKALIPLYIYVFLDWMFGGFSIWSVPNFYIWTVLWAVTMLLPVNMSKRKKYIVYPLICGLHGLLFGTMYAPFQAIMFGLNFKGTIAWIIAGLPFDAIHGAGNLVLGFLIVPLSELLIKLNSSIVKKV